MLYRKPEFFIVGASVGVIQAHVCKSSDHSDNPCPEAPIATATAYEVDE
jgi:hypothetical protein